MSAPGTVKKPPRFGGERIRSWGPKSRTGCLTCKRRRVKCDEGRPACRRCVVGNRQCEGYEESSKDTWVHETTTRPKPRSPSSASDSSGESDTGPSSVDPGTVASIDNAVPSIAQGRGCTRCGLSHIDIACPSNVLSTFFKPSDTPYRRENEQYLFKFFIEVVGAAVSRANISAYYWLGAFPQVAYASQPVRDTLLAAAAAFHQASGDVFVKTLPAIGISSMVYEGRAMRALSQGNPSVHEVLNTSMAFWVCQMCVGNWENSLQHLYHSLKIIGGLDYPSRHDQMLLRYQSALARMGLLYFRTTRGPCQKHGPGDFLNCDAECFKPEDKPLAHRMADSLHHLKASLPTFEMCVDLLQTRMEPHSHQSELESMLEKQLGEIRFLIACFANIQQYGVTPEQGAEALKHTPYTASPFDPVLSDLIRYIVNDQYSTGLAFQELELRVRVTIPNMLAATSRGNYRMIQDSIAIILHSGYNEGLLKVKGNFKFHGEHVRHLMRQAI